MARFLDRSHGRQLRCSAYIYDPSQEWWRDDWRRCNEPAQAWVTPRGGTIGTRCDEHAEPFRRAGCRAIEIVELPGPYQEEEAVERG